MEWTQLVMNAMSEFEYKNPGALTELQSITEENAWDHPKFADAAAAVVEPEQCIQGYQGEHDEALEFFHNKTEKEGMTFIKGIVQNDLWNHIIETVDKTGY